MFTFSQDFYPDIPVELRPLWKRWVDSCLKWILCPRSERLFFWPCDRQCINWSCVFLHRWALLGHISVCFHTHNPLALWDIHYELSWQCSKHSRDVFWGFVFPVFTKCLGQPSSRTQGTGAYTEVFGFSVEEHNSHRWQSWSQTPVPLQ